uniref:VWFA domain-containing protein n=1 Tax=Lepisosteus oculatus TaxID=7918 RepID=W5MSN9_LEPOC
MFIMKDLLKTAFLLWTLQLSVQDPAAENLVLRPGNVNGMQDCPINVYFTIDTSESVALKEYPWGSQVEELKVFLRMFVQKLQSTTLLAKQVQWSYGGLHFSDRVEVFSQVTSEASIFLARVNAISYIGRGTFIDCALRNMTEQVQRGMLGSRHRLQFAVVLTDGHITGSPCGGVQQAAEAAKAAGIKIFVVATSSDTMENELKHIASSPVELYRKDYLAFPSTSRESAVNRITDAMVKEGEYECVEQGCLRSEGPHGPKGSKGVKVRIRIINLFFYFYFAVSFELSI